MPNEPRSHAFPARLKRARLDQSGPRGENFSPEKLAALLGVSGQTVRNWEAGSAAPDLATIERLARVLGTTPGYLAFNEGEADRNHTLIRDGQHGIKMPRESPGKQSKRGTG